MTTQLPEPQLVELRAEGQSRWSQFVDSMVLQRCSQVLDRRGECWAASVLGRDISRRSMAVSNRPFLNAGEEYALVAADRAEDNLILDSLTHE
jgi:hypothetical protein